MACCYLWNMDLLRIILAFFLLSPSASDPQKFIRKGLATQNYGITGTRRWFETSVVKTITGSIPPWPHDPA